MIKKVKNIMADTLDVSEEMIDVDSTPETIESWDSLRHMNLVLAIEQAFGVMFTVDEIIKMQSMKKIIEFLNQKGR